MQLVGTEVKVLRQGLASINEAYATERTARSISSTRISRNIRRRASITSRAACASCCCTSARSTACIGAIKRDGMTLVPLSIYFNARGRAKLELGLAKGKRKADKREAEKQRDWQRDKARIMRDRNG